MNEHDILQTEFSESFISKMKERMIVSFFKYGPVKENVKLNNILSNLEVRLQKYRTTGNTEWLVDAANFLMIEFMYPQHPNAHFRSTDSNESPGLTGISINELKDNPP